MSYLQDLQVLTNWFVIRPTSSLRFRVLLLTKFFANQFADKFQHNCYITPFPFAFEFPRRGCCLRASVVVGLRANYFILHAFSLASMGQMDIPSVSSTSPLLLAIQNRGFFQSLGRHGAFHLLGNPGILVIRVSQCNSKFPPEILLSYSVKILQCQTSLPGFFYSTQQCQRNLYLTATKSWGFHLDLHGICVHSSQLTQVCLRFVLQGFVLRHHLPCPQVLHYKADDLFPST